MKLGFVSPNNRGLTKVNDVIDLTVEAEERGLQSMWGMTTGVGLVA